MSHLKLLRSTMTLSECNLKTQTLVNQVSKSQNLSWVANILITIKKVSHLIIQHSSCYKININTTTSMSEAQSTINSSSLPTITLKLLWITFNNSDLGYILMHFMGWVKDMEISIYKKVTIQYLLKAILVMEFIHSFWGRLLTAIMLESSFSMPMPNNTRWHILPILRHRWEKNPYWHSNMLM